MHFFIYFVRFYSIVEGHMFNVKDVITKFSNIVLCL